MEQLNFKELEKIMDDIIAMELERLMRKDNKPCGLSFAELMDSWK